jgi:hypothetical protein
MTVYGRRPLIGGESELFSSMTIGDLDGDGIDDIVLGSPEDNIISKGVNSGIVYVIFGVSSLPTSYDLLNHTVLTIYGDIADDGLGSAVHISDFNGDGYNDLIVGAEAKGYVYLFYGGSYLKSLFAPWDLSFQNANTTILGHVIDSFGASLTASDLNLDGIEDLIVGAPNSQGYNDLKTNCGEIVIIDGNKLNETQIDLDGSGPFINITTVYGIDSDDLFGTAIASNGDFNGDGIYDIAITAPGGKGPLNNKIQAGEAYVLYWNSSTVPGDWDLGNINTRANMTFFGNQTLDNFGLNSIAFGDFNDDFFDDVLVGAPNADEKLGGFDIGATYLFYGSPFYKPEPYSWDIELFTNKSNVTIMFPNDFDESGTWVSALDWNADNIDDILISAPYGDGPEESLTDIGEVVIINGSPFLQPRIDLSFYSPGFRMFGAEQNDHMGVFTAHGDIDGDSKMDLAIVANDADGEYNNRTDSGEAYILPGALALAPRIRSLKLLNGDGIANSTCFARLKPYKFEVNITTPLGIGDLTNVTLHIDPNGLDLKYLWDGDGPNDWFIEENDPNDYAEILSTPSNSTEGFNYWILSFNLMFNWNCPSFETLVPIHIELYNSNNYIISRNFFNVFNIESRLNFTGNLVVKDENDQILSDNAWLRSGKKLKWSGLTVIYENTTNVFPNTGEYEIWLWNSTTSWNVTSSPGTEINKTIFTGSSSIAQDNYILNITGIPPDKDLSDITFRIRVDADDIKFTNPIPDSAIWHTKSPVTCGITATDFGGNSVDASSMEYRISENNGTTWSNWTSAGETINDVSLVITKKIPFSDGNDNLIEWRGMDTIGNGYEVSDQYLIKLDTENLTFSKALPKDDQTFDKLDITFSIEISDNTSGVDASTIEYSYSVNNGVDWSDWYSLFLTGVHQSIAVNATQEFALGSGNLLKWRAFDAAGHGPIESNIQRFNIYISTTELKANLLDPTNNAEVGNATPKLIWDSNDNSSNILFDVYLDKVYSNVLNLKSPTKSDIAEKFYIVEEPLDDGGQYYWTVIPRNTSGKTGINVDGIWSFTIDLNVTNGEKPDIPVTSLIYPKNGSEIKTLKPLLKWSVSYKNPYNLELTYDIHLWKSSETQKEVVPDLSLTQYQWTKSLENNNTYNWQVGVKIEGFQRTYWSPIWEFSTNVPPVQDHYDFNLYTEEKTTFKIKQGDAKGITLKVQNLKNTTGTVSLSVTSSTMDSSLFNIVPKSVSLASYETKSVVLTITIPSDYIKGEYLFSVKGVIISN